MATFPSDTVPAAFELSGGHPALDFVNSLDNRFLPAGPKELLPDYQALLRFAEQVGLLNASQARELTKAATPASGTKVTRAARELREAMAAVLYAAAEQRTPAPAAIELLERCLQEAEPPRQLAWLTADSGARAALAWRWRGDQLKAAAFPLWLIAQAASQLMLSNALAHVRACEASSCRWLFLDVSKNHSRRWCNMKVCGNRAKARRFQERHGT